MARIRTIKPEFPQSESVGRLSRDARLLFIQLWTIVDDSGRARAASRMLASLLYPYDDDAPKLIDAWLTELERAGKVRLYTVEGSRYLEIPNWLEHQKIDKPSKSRLPQFVEASRGFAEASATDLGPSTLDPGPRDDGGGDAREPSNVKPLVSEAATALATEIAAVVGYATPKDWPPGWCGAPMRVQTMLDQGWRPEIMLATAREAMMRKPDGPPDTVNYFEKPFARAHARQAAPLPVVVVSNEPEVIHENTRQRRVGGNPVTTVIDARIADLRERAAAARDGDAR